MESILQTTENRSTIYPIIHKDIWNMYLTQRSSFWIPAEIDFSNDLNDWKTKLNDDERYFLKHILSFFASSDTLVNINIGLNFLQEITIPEAQFVYRYQSMMEDIHSETYSIMLDTLIDNIAEKQSLFNALETNPYIKQKAEWVSKWIINSNNESIEKRLLAFAIVEGIFFCGSFCAIYWIKQKGIMTGLCVSNEFISRDETMHYEFACILYNKFKNRLDEADVHLMFKHAVEVETDFIINAFPCKLIGMNDELMIKYIKNVCDKLLTLLNYNKLYFEENPFSFMNALTLSSKTNFFEHKVSQYQKSETLLNNVYIDNF